MDPGFSIGRSSGFASPPRAMQHWDDRSVAVDAGWDREGRSEGRRKRDPRGRPQGTVDRILQLGQSPLAAPQTAYVKYLTKELFQSPTGFDHLPYVEASICAAEPPA